MSYSKMHHLIRDLYQSQLNAGFAYIAHNELFNNSVLNGGFWNLDYIFEVFVF